MKRRNERQRQCASTEKLLFTPQRKIKGIARARKNAIVSVAVDIFVLSVAKSNQTTDRNGTGAWRSRNMNQAEVTKVEYGTNAGNHTLTRREVS